MKSNSMQHVDATREAINDDVTIVVVEIRGDKVRLGIDAPITTPVHRKEVYDAIKQSEQERNK